MKAFPQGHQAQLAPVPTQPGPDHGEGEGGGVGVALVIRSQIGSRKYLVLKVS